VGVLRVVGLFLGLSALEGLWVGRDPRSPVWWERHLSHGSFAWTGGQGPVTYVPGSEAPGMPEDVIDLLRKMGSRFE
jgi:hypothetical protein